MQGAKLKSARRAAGFSTRRVAELLPSYGVKLSHTTLANYESGSSVPSMDTLVALSELYRRPLQWFVSSTPSMTGIRYRRHKSGVKVSQIAKFEVDAQRYFEAYLALENFVGTSERRVVSMRIDGCRSGKQAAAELREHLGFTATQPIESAFGVLEEMGVRVIDLEADRRIDGLSAKLNEWDVVAVNRDKPPARLRLDAMHELFHLILGDCDNADDQGIVDAEEEQLAMDAASHFLAPDDVIRDAFEGKSMVRLVKFKETFGISLAAMVYRASRLGILSEAESRSLWIEFSKRGWRTKEPGTVRIDQPWRFEYLIDIFISGLQKSWQDLCDLTGLRESEMKERLAMRFGSHEEAEMPPREEVESPFNQGLRLVR